MRCRLHRGRVKRHFGLVLPRLTPCYSYCIDCQGSLSDTQHSEITHLEEDINERMDERGISHEATNEVTSTSPLFETLSRHRRNSTSPPHVAERLFSEQSRLQMPVFTSNRRWQSGFNPFNRYHDTSRHTGTTNDTSRHTGTGTTNDTSSLRTSDTSMHNEGESMLTRLRQAVDQSKHLVFNNRIPFSSSSESHDPDTGQSEFGYGDIDPQRFTFQFQHSSRQSPDGVLGLEGSGSFVLGGNRMLSRRLPGLSSYFSMSDNSKHSAVMCERNEGLESEASLPECDLETRNSSVRSSSLSYDSSIFDDIFRSDENKNNDQTCGNGNNYMNSISGISKYAENLHNSPNCDISERNVESLVESNPNRSDIRNNSQSESQCNELSLGLGIDSHVNAVGELTMSIPYETTTSENIIDSNPIVNISEEQNTTETNTSGADLNDSLRMSSGSGTRNILRNLFNTDTDTTNLLEYGSPFTVSVMEAINEIIESAVQEHDESLSSQSSLRSSIASYVSSITSSSASSNDHHVNDTTDNLSLSISHQSQSHTNLASSHNEDDDQFILNPRPPLRRRRRRHSDPFGSRSSASSNESAGVDDWYYYDPRLRPSRSIDVSNGGVAVDDTAALLSYLQALRNLRTPVIVNPPSYEETIAVGDEPQSERVVVVSPPAYQDPPAATLPTPAAPPPSYEQALLESGEGLDSVSIGRASCVSESSLPSYCSDTGRASCISESSLPSYSSNDYETRVAHAGSSLELVFSGISSQINNDHIADSVGVENEDNLGVRVNNSGYSSLETEEVVGPENTFIESDNVRNERIVGHEVASGVASEGFNGSRLFGGMPAVRWNRFTQVNRWTSLQPWVAS